MSTRPKKPIVTRNALMAVEGSGPRGTGTHKRNTEPMLAAARCGARTRAGPSCRAPRVGGKRRCRMHGGARGSGAPKGNRNAIKHGRYTKEEREWRRMIAGLMRECEEALRDLE